MNRAFALTLAGFAVILTSCETTQNTSQSPSKQAEASISQQLSRVGIHGCKRVRAYTINSGEKHPAPNKTGVIEGRLNPKRAPKEGVELSPAQVERFLCAAATQEYPMMHAECFYPHHALVFFGANDKIIGHYTICFMCLGCDSSVGKFASEPNYSSLRQLITELALPRP